jgi:hypothetical protein
LLCCGFDGGSLALRLVRRERRCQGKDLSGEGDSLVKWLLVAFSMALIPLASVPVLAQTTSASSPPDQCSATYDQYQTTCPPEDEPQKVEPLPEPGEDPPPEPEPPPEPPPEPVPDPAPGSGSDPVPVPVPPPVITVQEAGGAALKDSLTASEALNDSRNDGARELEEDAALAAEKPSTAHPTAASKTESHPAEVQAVGLSEKEAMLQVELGPVTSDHGAEAAPREGALGLRSNDDPAAIITASAAIDQNESEAVSWPAEVPAGPQVVASRLAEPDQLRPMGLTSPLLASVLVVAAGLLIRRSRRRL